MPTATPTPAPAGLEPDHEHGCLSCGAPDCDCPFECPGCGEMVTEAHVVDAYVGPGFCTTLYLTTYACGYTDAEGDELEA